MSNEAERLATAYIHELERNNLFKLMQTASDWHEKAQGCGCKHCRLGAINAQEMLETEVLRQFLTSEDAEEAWIVNFALGKLGKKDDE